MKNNNLQIITRLMLRLLPVQILLAAIGSVNGLVNSYFATNYVGIEAMSAVGLYGPANMLLAAFGTILTSGCAIICGRYLGQNQYDKLQGTFSLDILLSLGVSILFTILFVLMGMSGMTGLFTQDPTLKPIFIRYLLGQSIGIVPMILGSQLSTFLTMENRSRRTITASIVYIVVNLIFNYLFVQVLRLEELGLALASSLGMWVFFAVEAQYYFTKDSQLKFVFRNIPFNEIGRIIAIGFPGAAGSIYMTVRGLAINKLLEVHTGSMGLSAFSAANNLLNIFWAVPAGMMAVSRLLISVSIGEEDRQTLGDVMRVMARRYIPIMFGVVALIILGANPLASIFFKDSSLSVYGMTVSCLRILPFCMPLSTICMHFTCYGQASGKQGYVNVLAFLDGVFSVTVFSALLTGLLGLGVRGICFANVLNGLVSLAFIIGYSWVARKKFPRKMEHLMVIPGTFGAPKDDHIDISVKNAEEVVRLSEQIQNFCLSKGIDQKRSFYSALALEEMAGNIVEHGFSVDKRKHSIDIRVVYKDDNVIMRIKDDCVRFDPREWRAMMDDKDLTKNIGIRMVFRIIKDIKYQNLLGLNVLTMKI